MKIFVIILSLCVSQIVRVLGQSRGNCSDYDVSYNCDDYCFNYFDARPIQYGVCLQTNYPNGYYYYTCTCNFLNSCPKGDQQCLNSCQYYYNSQITCTYPRKGVTCACGVKFRNNPRVFFYALY